MRTFWRNISTKNCKDTTWLRRPGDLGFRHSCSNYGIFCESLRKSHQPGDEGFRQESESDHANTCVWMSYLCSMTRAPSRRLADVAKKVGVSEATVSRVLNGKAGVSGSTREAVLTALDVLGYERPTQLRGELAEVIGGALAQRGFTPVLCTRTAGGLSEADYVGMLLEQQVSGVVFAGGHYAEQAAPHEHYRLLRSRGVPVVLFNAAIDNLDFPCVSTDDVTAAGQAYTHLASLGHQRIGLVVGPEDHMPSRRKLAAFAQHGGGGAVEHALFSLEGGQAATTRLLRHGVTGVICGSDVLALGAIRAIRRAGRSVPGDVSVVGYDDSAFM